MAPRGMSGLLQHRPAHSRLAAFVVRNDPMCQSLADLRGGTLNISYLTPENIHESRNLFDLILLTWWELKTARGAVEHAHNTDVPGSTPDMGTEAAGLLREAIAQTWQTCPGFAGTRELDDGIRLAMVRVLEAWPPENTLVHVISELERAAAGVNERRTGVLNRCFQERLGWVFAAPRCRFRGYYTADPEPPGDYAEWPVGLLSELVVLPKQDHDVAPMFVEAAHSFLAPDGEATDNLVIGLADYCSSEDSVRMVTLAENDGTRRCRVDLVAGQDAAERVGETIRTLNAHGVHVAVLPELSMSSELMSVARETMQELYDQSMGSQPLRVLVAGSHHTQLNGVSVENVSDVIGPDGGVLWSQRKMYPYSWMDGGKHNSEALDTRQRVLHVCDTWFGRVIAPVCLDYLANPVSQLSRYLAIDCCLVPAMTPETTDFTAEARRRIRSSRMATVLVNASHRPDSNNTEAASSFVCLPVRGGSETTLQVFARRSGPLCDIVRVP